MNASSDISTLKGNIKVNWEEKKDNIKGDYEIRISADNQYISASGSYSLTSSDKLDIVKTDKAISIEDVDFDKVLDNIEDK